MKKYRGILFDLGGTLFEHQSTESAAQNLQHTAAQLGIDEPMTILRERMRQIRTTLEHAFIDRRFYLHRDLVLQSIEQFATFFGHAISASVAADYCDRQRQSVVSELQLRTDTIPTLKELRKRTGYMAIVSNIDNDYLDPLLARTGLGAYFEHCTSSEAAGSCKPDQAFFHHAMTLADLAPREVLFVGDSLLHDVIGANKIGMDVAWLATAGEEKPADLAHAEPTYRINSLSDLLAVASS